MSWRRSLDVSGGEVWFKAGGEEGEYTVKGRLECGNEFLVGFVKARYTLSGPQSHKKVPVRAGTIQLGPRQSRYTDREPQPSTFLELGQKLLLPPPRRRYGYEFLVHVEVQGAQLGAIGFDDESPGCCFELAHLQGPSIVHLTRGRQCSYESPEVLTREFEARWRDSS